MHKPNMASSPSASREPIHLYLDFDSTLTTSSTLSRLAQFALSVKSPFGSFETMSALTSAYAADLQAHNDSYPKPAAERIMVVDEYAYEASLEPVERASVERVEKAGVFAGVHAPAVLEQAAKAAITSGQVRLRPGWEDLVKTVLEGSADAGPGAVTVISVSWSRTWVRACLAAAADAGPELVGKMDILANEIDFEHPGSGMLDRRWPARDSGLWTGVDKVDAMLEHEQELQARSTSGVRPRTIYVGDSPTDLPCLVRAAAGICMRGREGVDEPSESGALLRVLERTGTKCAHVSEYVPNDPRTWCGMPWVRDFKEILQSQIFESNRFSW